MFPLGPNRVISPPEIPESSVATKEATKPRLSPGPREKSDSWIQPPTIRGGLAVSARAAAAGPRSSARAARAVATATGLRM